MRKLALLVFALVGFARSASAQLQYERTVFLHGLGEYYRWSHNGNWSNGVPQQMSGAVDFKNWSYIYSPNASAVVSYWSDGLRPQIQPQTVIIAHSMGGVVARDMLTNPSANVANNIAGLVTVASAHYGAPVAKNAGTLDYNGRGLISGFLDELAVTILNPLAGLVNAIIGTIINYIIETMLLNGIKIVVAELAGATSYGAQDLRPDGATIARLSTAYDTKPHASVSGITPERDAMWHLLGTMRYEANGNSYVDKKNKVYTFVTVCKAIFYNFLVKTAVGRSCNTTKRFISGLDATWVKWTKDGSSTPFDGLLPIDRTRYPGSSINSNVNFYAPFTNHFSIVKPGSGQNRIRDAMYYIGMVDPNAPPPCEVDCGGGGGGGGGGCEPAGSPECLEYLRAEPGSRSKTPVAKRPLKKDSSRTTPALPRRQ